MAGRAPGERRERGLATRNERRARRSFATSCSSLCRAIRSIISCSAASGRCGHTRRIGDVKSSMISCSRVVLSPVGSRTICMRALSSVRHAHGRAGREAGHWLGSVDGATGAARISLGRRASNEEVVTRPLMSPRRRSARSTRPAPRLPSFSPPTAVPLRRGQRSRSLR